MSVFDEVAVLVSKDNLEHLLEEIRLYVPPAEPFNLDFVRLAAAEKIISFGDQVVGFLTGAMAGPLTDKANRVKTAFESLQTNVKGAFQDVSAGRLAVGKLVDEVVELSGAIAPFVGAATLVNQDPDYDSATALRELKRDQKAVQNLRAEVERAAVGVREATSESATSRLSGDYEARATEHASAARRWLYGIGAIGTAFAGLVIWFLVEVTGLGAEEDVIPFLATKISIGAVLAYALFFCSRNYRANRHLEIAYTSRGTILQVAQALRSSVKDEVAQAAIMEAAVAAALSVPQSGLVRNSGEDDATTTGLLAMALSRGARDGAS